MEVRGGGKEGVVERKIERMEVAQREEEEEEREREKERRGREAESRLQYIQFEACGVHRFLTRYRLIQPSPKEDLCPPTHRAASAGLLPYNTSCA